MTDVEKLADCLGLVVKIQIGAVLEKLGDRDVAEFAAHAEVGDAEGLYLARVVGVGVPLHNPPVATAGEVVKPCERGAALRVGPVGLGHGLPRGVYAVDHFDKVVALLA